MKNIVAFGLCLAAFNAYGNDTENTQTQEIATIFVDEATQEYAPENEAVALEQTVEETATAPENNDERVTTDVQPQLLTLSQLQELFNSATMIEFLTARGFNSDEAFHQIVAMLHDINNNALIVDGDQADDQGVLLKINDETYFIKATEVMDATVTSNDEVVVNS